MKFQKRVLSTLLGILGGCCLLFAVYLLIHYLLEDKKAQEALKDYQNITVDATPITTEAPSAPPEPTMPPPEETGPPATATPVPTTTPNPAVENPYADAYAENGDMAAWLVIPDTNVDYPVMWTPEDENYYLYRDFQKRENKNGSLLLDTDSSLNPLTTNLIIHGHNMKSGAMFGNLTDYESEKYYKEHNRIILHTPQCQRNYEIIAVFRSQVYKKTDDVFKFYKFFQADTEEEFLDFYENIKKLSLYDTGVTAEFGDRFITLSTCVYHVTNGRFVVVAKEVEPGNEYLPLD